MIDRVILVGVWVLRPVEVAWGWHVRRQYRRGKFRRPTP